MTKAGKAGVEGKAGVAVEDVDKGVEGEGDDKGVAVEDVDSKDKGSSREARYRVRAKEAEARAEALEATVMAYHQRDVDRLVGGRVTDPEDFWRLSDVDLGDLLDEETGVVSEEAVTAAVDELLERKPHLAREEPVDFDGGSRRPVATSTASWQGLLRSGRQ